MSFEGYYQVICQNGHLFNVDALLAEATEELACPDCTAKVAWWNLVDVTNGSFDDDGKRIDGAVEIEIDKEAPSCKCPTCGHEHMVGATTYHIPEKHGHRIRKLRA